MECPGFKCSKASDRMECAKIEHWIHDLDLMIDAVIHGGELIALVVEGPIIPSKRCSLLRIEIHFNRDLTDGEEYAQAIVRVDINGGEPIVSEYEVGRVPYMRGMHDPCIIVNKLTKDINMDNVMKAAEAMLSSLCGKPIKLPIKC